MMFDIYVVMTMCTNQKSILSPAFFVLDFVLLLQVNLTLVTNCYFPNDRVLLFVVTSKLVSRLSSILDNRPRR